MKLETIQYTASKGWSAPSFPDLDSKNTLVLLFADPEFIDKQGPIKELIEHYPTSQMIGCSSAGEIYNATVNDNSISVAIIKFEKTEIKVYRTKIANIKDSCKAGTEIFDNLNSQNLSGMIVLSNGININGSELVKGLNEHNNSKIPVMGGLAGDGPRFGKTWAVYNGEVTTDTVVAVGLYGKHINIGHGSRGGWDVFGPERRITKSEGNVVFEIDGTPALKLYKEYLGERAAELPASGLLFPISIRKDKNDKNSVVRTILAVDESNQSLTFAGDVPTGCLAQLMRANFDKLIASAEEAGAVAETGNSNSLEPQLSIAISCVGRRLLLGQRTEEEVESLLEIFPKDLVKQIGFYSYGEISPFASGDCSLHNQTMTVTVLSEAS